MFQIFDVKPEYHDLPMETLNLDEQKFLGKAKCFLSQIVTNSKMTSKLQLEGQLKGGVGTLTVHWEELVPRDLGHSFLHYVSGGFELKFIIAADFKVLNGNPQLPEFWRGLDPSLDPFVQVIHDIMEVMKFYSSHIRFPARDCDTISHCFDLHGLADWPSLMKDVAEIATIPRLRKEPKYFVFLIATDKFPTHKGFRDALVRASDLPLSVLVTNVHYEVQVPSGEVRCILANGSTAEALLTDVPEQFISYVRRWRIKIPSR